VEIAQRDFVALNSGFSKESGKIAQSLRF